MYRCAELLLQAHAVAYRIIKAAYPNAQVGIAKHILGIEAASPRWVNGPFAAIADWGFNRAFLEALTTGILHFPAQRKIIMPQVVGTSDYLGLNFYQRYRIAVTPFRKPFIGHYPDPDSPPPPPLWGEIYPHGIFKVIQRMFEMTRLPIYITETGTPDIGDEVRRWYIAKVVHSVWRAINFNYPVKGLYYWSLLDSFEWTAAYNPQFRFGLYEMDFATQARTQRSSAEFYSAICAAKGLSQGMVRQYSPSLEASLFPSSQGLQTVNLPAKI
jgi:beta-glucosidase